MVLPNIIFLSWLPPSYAEGCVIRWDRRLTRRVQRAVPESEITAGAWTGRDRCGALPTAQEQPRTLGARDCPKPRDGVGAIVSNVVLSDHRIPETKRVVQALRLAMVLDGAGKAILTERKWDRIHRTKTGCSRRSTSGHGCAVQNLTEYRKTHGCAVLRWPYILGALELCRCAKANGGEICALHWRCIHKQGAEVRKAVRILPRYASYRVPSLRPTRNTPVAPKCLLYHRCIRRRVHYCATYPQAQDLGWPRTCCQSDPCKPARSQLQLQVLRNHQRTVVQLARTALPVDVPWHANIEE